MEALRFLVAALTKNWGLKLLALGLAIIIYHSMKPTENRTAQETNHGRIFQER